MKAISFIGASAYQTVTYCWREDGEERRCQTHLFPEAVARIFEPEKLVILVTPTARSYKPPDREKTHLETLVERLGDLVEPVDIPEGRSEAELWEIFSRCVEAVGEGEEILLDVTHAFRSLPLIVFAVAAYLRRAKEVNVCRIVYGAFEARQPFRTPPEPTDRAPILDLTPLLDLMDWLSGAEAFMRRSDAEMLANRLEETHRRLWKSRAEMELPRRLQTVGRKLRDLSRALYLGRPLDVMREANGLLSILQEAAAEARRWALPFAVLLEQIHAAVERLAYESPEVLNPEHLRKQLRIIEHYLQKGLYMQPVLLAREWVVNWVILQRGGGDWLDRSFREEVERALGAADAAWVRKRSEAEPLPEWFKRLPRAEEIAKLWSWLADLRNDLAHCGMRKGTAPARSVEGRARELPQRLGAFLSDAPNRTLRSDRVMIDLKQLYGEVAKLEELPLYIEKALDIAGEGKEVVLTGQAPIWLYLAVAHALHGRMKKLIYDSPVTGEVVIFDHTAR